MKNLDKKIELVTQILTLSMEISTTSIIDIFVEYSSHVQALHVRCILNGWKPDCEYDFEKGIYLDWDSSENNLQDDVEIEKELQDILDYLKRIKEEL